MQARTNHKKPWCPRGPILFVLSATLFLVCVTAPAASGADLTNTVSPLLVSPSLPDTAPSLLRVLGALALVLGIFLGAVWFLRNGRQIALRGGAAPRLNVFETRSLGGRQALYVVGYDQDRFLVAATPAGINLLSHLPSASPEESQALEQRVPFAKALAQMLKGQTASPGKSVASK